MYHFNVFYLTIVRLNSELVRAKYPYKLELI